MRFTKLLGIFKKKKTSHPVSATRADLIVINKKKRICHLVSADYKIKIKESKILDRYQKHTRELKSIKD